MGNTRKVSEGLHLIYQGNIVAIIAALCTLLVLLAPLLGLLSIFVLLVGAIISLVGLARLRNEHEAYMKALILCVIGMAFGLLSNNQTTFGSLMGLVQSICGLIQTYFVIQGTNSFLQLRTSLGEVAMGERAWKWQLISTAVGVAVVVLTYVLAPLAVVLSIINLVVSIIALIFYLSYLKASAAALS